MKIPLKVREKLVSQVRVKVISNFFEQSFKHFYFWNIFLKNVLKKITHK